VSREDREMTTARDRAATDDGHTEGRFGF
jgi:hypothetical protein